MAKAPAFQFYVGDFLRGTLYFNTLEIGAYLLLLCHQWDYNYIPEDEIELITRTTKDNLIRVLKKFKITEHGLQNEKLEEIRMEQTEYKKRQSDKGKASAEKRWGKDNRGYENGNRGYNLVTSRLQPECNPSTSSSTSYKSSSSFDVFEVMRRQLLPTQFSDSYIREEATKFVKKYKGQDIKNAGALISTWISNMVPDIQPKRFVN